MITQEQLRRASANPGVVSTIEKLSKDTLIRKKIDLVADTEAVPGSSTLLRMKFVAPNQQNDDHEIEFAEKISRDLGQALVMTGQAKAIDAFVLASGQPVQLKSIMKDNPQLPPGNVVDAAKQARQTAFNQHAGWRGIWVYIESPRPLALIRQRWNQSGTQPMLTINDLDGTISKVVVYAADGKEELPLKLPAAK